MDPRPAGDRVLARGLRSVGTKLAGATLAILGIVTAVVFLYTSRIERERKLSAKEDTGVVVTRGPSST